MGNELVKQEAPQSFIERLIEHAEDLEKVKEVGMVIINSGFCPEHFKQSKDAVGAIMCIEAGRKLGLTWMQSLSDIYPVKGRIGIMGSAAKSVIFSSGVLDKWEEVTEGTFPNDDYKHIIVSKRKGLPGEFRSEFSVYDAKKAGLFSKDIYQRYGKRMIMWRNVGFHSTDYYGDIMKGMKTVEELNDFDVIPGVGDTTIEKEDGTKINITAGAKGKSTKMTDRVADKIPDNKFGAVSSTITEAVIVPPEANKESSEPEKKEEPVITATRESSESMYGVKVIRDSQTNAITNMEEINAAKPQGSEVVQGELTLEQMEQMDTPLLLKMVMEDMDMMEAAETIGGKNTNKKLREIIFAHQNNELDKHVAPYLKAIKEKEDAESSATVSTAPPVDTTKGEIHLNKEFDQQKTTGTPVAKNQDILTADVKKPEVGNKYGLIIPEFDKGEQREFGTMKQLFNTLGSVTPPINNTRYLELAGPMGLLAAFPDREAIAKFGTVKIINELLNKN
jgi:CheY-like chemotaxis protein